MFQIFQVLNLFLVAVAMAGVLAHVMELPGKMRLSKENYLVVQPIYYPGFTIAGSIGELGGMLTTIALVAFYPVGTTSFWLVLFAALAMIAMHAVYWTVTHPVNNFWLRDFNLQGAGKSFFSFGAGANQSNGAPQWTDLRDRWEYSHVVRSVFASLAFVLLAINAVVT